jgi:hypothetical protein
MKDKIGRLNGNLVWAFALGAIVLGIAGAWLTANMGNKVSAGVYFGVFAAAGFLSVFLTRSKTGMGVLAFVVAAVASAGIYYFLVSSILSEATTTMAAAAGGAQGDAQMAGNVMGTTMGLFAAGLIFLDTLIAGIGGCIFGAKQRKKFVRAS